MFRLLILFTLVPFVELILLLWLSDRTSWLFTLGLIFFTGILGAALARAQGWRTWLRLQQEMRSGRVPAVALMDGAMILVAGALLVTPGILTDAVGFALLTPPFRAAIRHLLVHRLKERVHFHATYASRAGSTQFHGQPGSHTSAHDDEVIDVQVVEPPNGKSST